MHERAEELAEKQRAHQEKFSRKLKVVKAQEQEELGRVEAEVAKEREEAVAEIERRV